MGDVPILSDKENEILRNQIIKLLSDHDYYNKYKKGVKIPTFQYNLIFDFLKNDLEEYPTLFEWLLEYPENFISRAMYILKTNLSSTQNKPFQDYHITINLRGFEKNDFEDNESQKYNELIVIEGIIKNFKLHMIGRSVRCPECGYEFVVGMDEYIKGFYECFGCKTRGWEFNKYGEDYFNNFLEISVLDLYSDKIFDVWFDERCGDGIINGIDDVFNRYKIGDKVKITGFVKKESYFKNEKEHVSIKINNIDFINKDVANNMTDNEYGYDSEEESNSYCDDSHTIESKIEKWSNEVIKRDKFCQCCGSNDFLEAHNIYGDKNKPDFYEDIKNGIVLCSSCHEKYHSKYSKEKTNLKELYDFFIDF